MFDTPHRDAFRNPVRVWSRDEVLTKPSPVPNAPGVYGWYLKEVPPGVPASGCVTHNGLTLLYIGIAPKPPSKTGKASTRTLRGRIRQHYSLNAEGSTLRLTLGCLLQERLGIQLRRVGSGTRMTFGAGEKVLSQWMGENAFVCWVEHPMPWDIEPTLIRELLPPLNLATNKSHPFCAHLSGVRAKAKARARSLAVMPDGFEL